MSCDQENIVFLFSLMMEGRRKDLGLTQKQLAEASGLSLSSIDNYAHGRYQPTVTAIVAIAKALNCSPNYLLGWEE